MKKVICVLLVLVAMTVIGCSKQDNSADIEMQRKTELALQEAGREIGLPGIVNYQEKKNLKWIYELCDQENLICHAYLFNVMNGTIGQYLGECIGYGIPYSTQFSNPEKAIGGDKAQGYSFKTYTDPITLPQAEPNGLFKPTGLSATWLIMIDPETKKPRPVYIEPEIIVSPFKLK